MPVPPAARLTEDQKAKMKKPGDNPWNDFQASMKGQGYSGSQLRDMFHRLKDAGLLNSDPTYTRQAVAKAVSLGALPPELIPTGSSSSAYSGPHSDASTVRGPGTAPQGPNLGVRYDLNKATHEQLMTIPGCTTAVADSILRHRANHPPFTAVNQLMKVRFVGKVTYEKMSPHLCIGSLS